MNLTTLLDTLNAAHGIPGQLAFVVGPGGSPWVQIDNAHARARVSLHGGQVLSYAPAGAGGDDRPEGVAADAAPTDARANLLFLSERATHQAGRAIRGGVPVCWPWFGPDPQGLGRPAHGFARTRPWAVTACSTTLEGATQLSLCLQDTPETRALWPHAFVLTLAITVGPTLHLALTTRNTGDTALDITQALHSYFAVSDLTQVAVTGLDGCRYTDKATGANGQTPVQSGPVFFTQEVDRVYTGAPAALQLQDAGLRRRIGIRSEGSRSAVVWNPGAALAAGMADLAADAYRRFVCVETANAGDEVVTLEPGAEHRLVAEIGLLA